eukprot:EC821817.1.p1 GENE.EC821817.1~~EC821817.1.p1  ORF type:complete len:153 (+),score=39.78 EC821817.1:2-460(+)
MQQPMMQQQFQQPMMQPMMQQQPQQQFQQPMMQQTFKQKEYVYVQPCPQGYDQKVWDKYLHKCEKRKKKGKPLPPMPEKGYTVESTYKVETNTNTYQFPNSNQESNTNTYQFPNSSQESTYKVETNTNTYQFPNSNQESTYNAYEGSNYSAN